LFFLSLFILMFHLYMAESHTLKNYALIANIFAMAGSAIATIYLSYPWWAEIVRPKHMHEKKVAAMTQAFLKQRGMHDGDYLLSCFDRIDSIDSFFRLYMCKDDIKEEDKPALIDLSRLIDQEDKKRKELMDNLYNHISGYLMQRRFPIFMSPLERIKKDAVLYIPLTLAISGVYGGNHMLKNWREAYAAVMAGVKEAKLPLPQPVM